MLPRKAPKTIVNLEAVSETDQDNGCEFGDKVWETWTLKSSKESKQIFQRSRKDWTLKVYLSNKLKIHDKVVFVSVWKNKTKLLKWFVHLPLRRIKPITISIILTASNWFCVIKANTAKVTYWVLDTNHISLPITQYICLLPFLL